MSWERSRSLVTQLLSSIRRHRLPLWEQWRSEMLHLSTKLVSRKRSRCCVLATEKAAVDRSRCQCWFGSFGSVEAVNVIEERQLLLFLPWHISKGELGVLFKNGAFSSYLQTTVNLMDRIPFTERRQVG